MTLEIEDQTSISLGASLKSIASTIHRYPDAIGVTGADGNYIIMNEAHAELFGYAPEDLLGRHWSSLYTTEIASKIEKDVFPQLMSNGIWRGYLSGLSKTGRPVQQDLLLMTFSNGFILCITRDVDEKIEFERRQAALEEGLRALDRHSALAGDLRLIVHDMANVVSSMKISLDMLEMTCGEELKNNNWFMSMRDSALELISISHSDIFDAEERECVDIDIVSILKTLSDIASSVKLENQNIILELPDEPIMIHGNSTLISRALMNVIKNSLEHGQLGGVVKISIISPDENRRRDCDFQYIKGYLRGKGAGIRVIVSDTGPGIDEHVLRRGLETGIERRRGNLRGLGLKSVAELVDSGQCIVNVTSSVGSGTSFSFEFLAAVGASESIISHSVNRAGNPGGCLN